MSNCETEELPWESLFSSGKKKKVKKKAKGSPNKKNNLTEKTKDDPPKKKKKNAKVIDEIKERKKSKKKERRKKDTFPVILHDKIVNVQSLSNCLENETGYIEELTSESITEEKSKKSKRKKHVAFDLSHYNKAKLPKRPSFILPLSSNSKSGNSCMDDAEVLKPNQSQTKENDSESTSQDMHSQDLFITQKTFGVSQSQVSSEEASDRGEDITEVTEVFYRKTKEESVLFKTQKIKMSSDETQEKLKSSPAYPFLDEPVIVSNFPDTQKNVKHSSVWRQLSHTDQQQKSMTCSDTQTENFYTTELTRYLGFCQKNKSKAQPGELKPLDLSLPNRARRDLRSVVSSSCLCCKELLQTKTKRKLTKEMKGGSGQLSGSMNVQDKGDSPQSESDHKSAETSASSSEDTEAPNRTANLDLLQVRAVQMRLNESFYFKTKGERPSPRPESPLMKLVQGREVKHQKMH